MHTGIRSCHRAIKVGPPALLFLSLSMGCRSIPIMVPDMARKPTPSVQINGAYGPLTLKQSQEILSRLKINAPATSIFDRHLAVETAIVGTPMAAGNRIELLIDGPTTYESMFTAICKATSNINMETYIIEDDEIGRTFSRLLIAKQKSGVQVNLIYDSVGSISTPTAFFDSMKQQGINVLQFNPINPLVARRGWQVNQRDHRKLLIVDGLIAFVGGINISSVYSSGSFGRARVPKGNIPWRDTHLRMEGPVVLDFQSIFLATWSQQKGDPLAPSRYFPEQRRMGSEVVRAIASSPEEPYSQIYATLLSAINNAESKAYITNAYFVPDPQLLAALKNASRRGVDVRLLLPGKSDSSLVLHASHSYYDELLASGVKIYERKEAVLHAKTATIDGVWSTIGSTNLDWRSFLHNQEINAVVLGQDFGSQMERLFEKDLASSKLITLHAWRARPISARIKERAARLWARWL